MECYFLRNFFMDSKLVLQKMEKEVGNLSKL